MTPAKPREAMTVYTIGFPHGRVVAHGRNPAVRTAKGVIGGVSPNDPGRPSPVQLDGELNPGTRGGPILDGDSRLVGLAV
jgi:S1-C subfamily serine protease